MLSITTTLLGEALAEEVVYRTGARLGDDLYITGTPGDSALGLHVLEKLARSKPSVSVSEEEKVSELEKYRVAIKRHNSPCPRLGIGRMLATGAIATSMIDVSDGVVLDATRLSKESRVGLTIEAPLLPLSKEMTTFMGSDPETEKAGLTMALAGGEDYELLFTARKEDRERIAAIAKQMQLPITVIGSVTTDASASGDTSGDGSKNSPDVRVLNEHGAEIPLERGGYTHF
jgi:thiamine-monophosphate kinase